METKESSILQSMNTGNVSCFISGVNLSERLFKRSGFTGMEETTRPNAGGMIQIPEY
jgi:hypothetical protein